MAVTTKVTQGAKNFGSFLYSAVNKASSKIKETVKDNVSSSHSIRTNSNIFRHNFNWKSNRLQNILGEFNKEQEEFIKSQQGFQNGAVPWAGHPNEEKVKEEILGLSSVSWNFKQIRKNQIHSRNLFLSTQDRRNFVRAPPAGVDFEFNYDLSYPTAVAIMGEDQLLEKMRFDLVVSELILKWTKVKWTVGLCEIIVFSAQNHHRRTILAKLFLSCITNLSSIRFGNTRRTRKWW